jgi:UDPglucose 6-dehydrogenase
MKQPLLFDLRNIYESDRVAGFGFRHVSVGRLPIEPSA